MFWLLLTVGSTNPVEILNLSNVFKRYQLKLHLYWMNFLQIDNSRLWKRRISIMFIIFSSGLHPVRWYWFSEEGVKYYFVRTRLGFRCVFFGTSGGFIERDTESLLKYFIISTISSGGPTIDAFTSNMSGDLQATLEISVELSTFHNVDLFQRG